MSVTCTVIFTLAYNKVASRAPQFFLEKAQPWLRGRLNMKPRGAEENSVSMRYYVTRTPVKHAGLNQTVKNLLGWYTVDSASSDNFTTPL